MENQKTLPAQIREVIGRLEQELDSLKETQSRVKQELRQHRQALKALAEREVVHE